MDLEADRRLSQHQFESRILGNSRDVWIQTSSSDTRSPPEPPKGVLLFLDAEHCRADVSAIELVDELQRTAAMPGLLPVYVSHIDYPTRWRESFCNPDFAAFLSSELMPWVVKEFAVSGELPNAVVGLSLTGLAAAHAALQHPEMLPRVVCQSASFWWREGWLIDDVLRRPVSEVTLHISVGVHEVDENVDHGDGLIQKESQLSSNRRMRNAIASKGFAHTYREFDGGHDFASFRRDLPDALSALQSIES